MVSRLILNLKSAAQMTAVWGSSGVVSGISVFDTYRVDNDGDESNDEDEGGSGFRVGIKTEGPAGVELSNLFVTRQEMGKISRVRESRLSKLVSSGNLVKGY
ncbi:hypothetical protein NMY22_g13105 [Coprinellus aureogranulatus]|nr:hypothetical protein NMY22_g13105 [Coprinellus aureogranulatus]